jgi:hypothetical protein
VDRVPEAVGESEPAEVGRPRAAGGADGHADRGVALADQHRETGRGKRLGQSETGRPAAGDDDVVIELLDHECIIASFSLPIADGN